MVASECDTNLADLQDLLERSFCQSTTETFQNAYIKLFTPSSHLLVNTEWEHFLRDWMYSPCKTLKTLLRQDIDKLVSRRHPKYQQ